MKHDAFILAFNLIQHNTQLLQVIETEISQEEKFCNRPVLVKFIDSEWSQ